ncbi:MAG: hypothetical protein KR126chlam6_00437 [Candidatus Anoxychlamydiales bacterium]|nr:hypothetical protein [Candidatus Anoxychlamydiales bacterium]
MRPVEYISGAFQRAKTYATEQKDQITNTMKTFANEKNKQIHEGFGKVKTFAKDRLITKEEREQIKEAATKVYNFIKENKAIIFFGFTVLFSYYMAPASAMKYLAEKGLSLKTSFLTGVFLGAGVLALKNIFIAPSNKKEDPNSKKMLNDRRATLLIAISNICQTLISPIAGLVYATATAGFMLIKTAYVIFSKEEVKEEIKKGKKYFLALQLPKAE